MTEILKIVKIEGHEFEIFNLPYNHYVECIHCYIQRHSDWVKIGVSISEKCISDEEKMIKKLIE